MIDRLYKEYIQKSRIFIYPLLDIKKGSDAVPLESYISWQGLYTPSDYKYICLYHLRDDEAFKKFEKVKLINNKLFDSYYETEDNCSVYVFDLKSYSKDLDCFREGRYTQISTETKNKILKFFMNSKSNYHHINSYLNPEIYYEVYGKLLGVNESLLREVGELCSKPDLEKETLIANLKSIPLFRV